MANVEVFTFRKAKLVITSELIVSESFPDLLAGGKEKGNRTGHCTLPHAVHSSALWLRGLRAACWNMGCDGSEAGAADQ